MSASCERVSCRGRAHDPNSIVAVHCGVHVGAAANQWVGCCRRTAPGRDRGGDYGWNWSGKTTISELLRNLECATSQRRAFATLTVDGRDLTNTDFPTAGVSLRVFNRHFVAATVFPTQGADLAPIFVLGEGNAEKQKKLDQIRTDLTDAREAVSASHEAKSRAATALATFCTNRGTLVRNLLRSHGDNPYNNYDKRNFERRADQMAEARDSANYELSDDERQDLLAQSRSSQMGEQELLEYRLPDLQAIARPVAHLLSQTVLSSAIESLKHDTPLSDWLHGGLALHRERASTTCLFCTRPIPTNRLAILEQHFSSQYDDLMRSIDEETLRISAASRDLDSLSLPQTGELYPSLSSSYESARAALLGQRDLAKSALDKLTEALAYKRTQPFASLTPDTGLPDLDPFLHRRTGPDTRRA